VKVNNISQIFNEKIQNINSRIKAETNINNKFQEILEQTQLKNYSSSSDIPSEASTTQHTTSTVSDVDSLLKTMLSTQSLLNSSSGFSDSSSSGLFPTSSLNNSINMIQQTQLLNALRNTNLTNKQ